MKLIAWLDRGDRTAAAKDARDIDYVLRNYDRLPSLQDLIYEDLALLNHYGNDEPSSPLSYSAARSGKWPGLQLSTS